MKKAENKVFKAKIKKKNLIGDSLLVALSIIYLGPLA